MDKKLCFCVLYVEFPEVPESGVREVFVVL